MKLAQHNCGILNDSGEFVSFSDEWVITVNTKQDAEWTQKHLMLTAKKEIDIQAIIYERIPYEQVLENVHAESAKMLINSANINNGTAGLTSFPVKPEKLVGEPSPESIWWTLIKGKTSVLFGFLPPIKHRTFLRQKDGCLEIGCWIDRKLKAGEVFIGDVIGIKSGPCEHELLETFGDFCKRLTPGRLSQERPLAWNSWDYYWSCFDEKDLTENLKVLQQANLTLPQPIQALVLDDGWFTGFGDWYANGRFSCGLVEVAEQIKAAGFLPGLWLAPFIVNCSSKVFLRTPEVLTKNTQGFVSPEAWGAANVGFLDPTCPAGEKFLFDTFRSLTNMGFRYYKLDFLHYLITQQRRLFYRDKMGRIDILRLGLQIIRDAVGDESYILACGCPPEATIGIVDSCRITGDISTYFSTTKIQASFLSSRYWMNQRLFTADPDFLIVRGAATATDTDFYHNPYQWKDIADAAGSRSGAIWMTDGEPRIWATLVALSGGALTLADYLGKLNPTGWEILTKALKLASIQSARPIDMMEQIYPSYWLREDIDKTVLGIINWSDDTAEFTVEKKCKNGIEFWTGQNFCGSSLKIPARDARVIIWHKN